MNNMNKHIPLQLEIRISVYHYTDYMELFITFTENGLSECQYIGYMVDGRDQLSLCLAYLINILI